MATMKGLTIWVDCPKTGNVQSVEKCFKCNYYAGAFGHKLQCIFEDK